MQRPLCLRVRRHWSGTLAACQWRGTARLSFPLVFTPMVRCDQQDHKVARIGEQPPAEPSAVHRHEHLSTTDPVRRGRDPERHDLFPPIESGDIATNRPSPRPTSLIKDQHNGQKA